MIVDYCTFDTKYTPRNNQRFQSGKVIIVQWFILVFYHGKKIKFIPGRNISIE